MRSKRINTYFHKLMLTGMSALLSVSLTACGTDRPELHTGSQTGAFGSDENEKNEEGNGTVEGYLVADDKI